VEPFQATENALPENNPEATPVQVFPSTDLYIWCDPVPTASHSRPLHATSYRTVVPVIVAAVHTFPSTDHTTGISLDDPSVASPTATHKYPLHATRYAQFLNKLPVVPPPNRVPAAQFTPSEEYASTSLWLDLVPAATQIDPFHATWFAAELLSVELPNRSKIGV